MCCKWLQIVWINPDSLVAHNKPSYWLFWAISRRHPEKEKKRIGSTHHKKEPRQTTIDRLFCELRVIRYRWCFNPMQFSISNIGVSYEAEKKTCERCVWNSRKNCPKGRDGACHLFLNWIISNYCQFLHRSKLMGQFAPKEQKSGRGGVGVERIQARRFL